MLIVAIVATSCGSKKTLFDRMNEGKQEAIAWCNLNVPIVVKPGKVIEKTDTVEVPGDTVKIPCPDGTIVDCPPSKTKTVTRTVTQRDTIIDTRALENERLERLKVEQNNAKLNGFVEVREKEIEDQKDKNKKLVWWIVGLGASTLIGSYFSLRGIFA